MTAPETEYPSGWYTPAEKELLAKAAQAAPDGDLVEIGVYRGESARVLAEHHGNRTLVLCDDMSHPGADLRLWPKGAFIAPVYDFLDLTQENIALLHHDADHSYEVVQYHLDEMLPGILPGGLVCLHDFHGREYRGVKRAWASAAQDSDWEDFGRAETLQVWRRHGAHRD